MRALLPVLLSLAVIAAPAASGPTCKRGSRSEVRAAPRPGPCCCKSRTTCACAGDEGAEMPGFLRTAQACACGLASSQGQAGLVAGSRCDTVDLAPGVASTLHVGLRGRPALPGAAEPRRIPHPAVRLPLLI